MSSYPVIAGLEIRGPMNPGYAEILTPDGSTGFMSFEISLKVKTEGKK